MKATAKWKDDSLAGGVSNDTTALTRAAFEDQVEKEWFSPRIEFDWDVFFGTLHEVGFDGIMTACVFAWEERAEDSSRFMRQTMQQYVDQYWGPHG